MYHHFFDFFFLETNLWRGNQWWGRDKTLSMIVLVIDGRGRLIERDVWNIEAAGDDVARIVGTTLFLVSKTELGEERLRICGEVTRVLVVALTHNMCKIHQSSFEVWLENNFNLVVLALKAVQGGEALLFLILI